MKILINGKKKNIKDINSLIIENSKCDYDILYRSKNFEDYCSYLRARNGVDTNLQLVKKWFKEGHIKKFLDNK